MPKVPDAYVKARVDEILKASVTCFSRSGYQRTSMADIAKAAGLSVGALYRYFKSKDELFHALARIGRDSNAAIWASAEAFSSPAEQLNAVIDIYFEKFADPACGPGLGLDIRFWSEALDSELIREELHAAYQYQVAEFAKRIEAAKSVGADKKAGVRKKTADAEARALIGLIHEARLECLMIPEFDLAAYRVAVDAFVRLCTRGG